jgi:hypothetical protein
MKTFGSQVVLGVLVLCMFACSQEHKGNVLEGRIRAAIIDLEMENTEDEAISELKSSCPLLFDDQAFRELTDERAEADLLSEIREMASTSPALTKLEQHFATRAFDGGRKVDIYIAHRMLECMRRKMKGSSIGGGNDSEAKGQPSRIKKAVTDGAE